MQFFEKRTTVNLKGGPEPVKYYRIINSLLKLRKVNVYCNIGGLIIDFFSFRSVLQLQEIFMGENIEVVRNSAKMYAHAELKQNYIYNFN